MENISIGFYKVWDTHIQMDEINKTEDIERKNMLNEVFNEISNPTPTRTGRWGISKWGQAGWGDGQEPRFLKVLDSIDKRKNNSKDSLIADTVLKNDWILVTDDGPLTEAMHKFKGKVINLTTFLELESPGRDSSLPGGSSE